MAEEGSRKVIEDLPRTGDVFDGKWRLDKVLGKGAMGVVFAGAHVTTGRRVAVKFLFKELVEHGEALERFLREAKVGGLADHTGIARVLDFSHTPSGHPFLVMEYADGVPMEQLIEGLKGSRRRRALEYVIDVLSTLDYIHERRVIHRDLKPANIICDTANPPRTWILDFGVARAAREAIDLTGVTDKGMTVGTPSYMSPEQAQARKDIGPPTDIWAMGVIFYQIVTGVRPFVGESTIDVVAAVLTEDPVPPTQLKPGLPKLADHIVKQALAKEPEARYQSAAAMAADLLRFADALGGRRARVRSQTFAGSIEYKRRRSWWPWVAAAGIVAFAGVLLFFTLPRGAGEDGAAVEPEGSDEVPLDELGSGPPLRMVWIAAGPRDRQIANLAWVRRAFIEETGRPVELLIPDTYEQAIEQVVDDEVDFGGLPPATFVLTRERDPKLLLLARVTAEGGKTYQSVLVTLSESSVAALSDVVGKKVCMVDPRSTSGNLYPRVMLRAAGVDPDEGPSEVRFAGSHLAALQALDRGDCDVAGVANTELEPWMELSGKRLGAIRILATSPSIPGDALVARDDLPEDVLVAIRRTVDTLIARTEAGERPKTGSYDGLVRAAEDDYAGIRAVVREAR